MAKKKDSAPSPALKQKPAVSKEATLLAPQLSVVFIQTFTLPRSLRFDATRVHTGFLDPNELNRDVWSFLVDNDLPNQAPLSEHYELPGFDFHFVFPGYPDIPEMAYDFEGTCKVKLEVFFGKTISLSYRFNFDHEVCRSKHPFTIDRIIYFVERFVATDRSWYSSEFLDDEKAIYSLPLLRDGSIDSSLSGPIQLAGKDCTVGALADIRNRYKSFVLRHCTSFRDKVSHPTQQKAIMDAALNKRNEDYYAYVDFPPSLQLLDDKGHDLFSLDRDDTLSNGEVITRIKTNHKKELMGLVSLCPEIWWSRNEEMYDDICGPDITLDSDDFVCVGDRVALLFRSYGRDVVNFGEFLDESRAFDGVSWPECLLMLQFYLAQRSVIRYATRTLLHSAIEEVNPKHLESVISRNQELSFYLSKSMLQYEAIRYTRVSNEKMAKSILNRLNIKPLKEEFEHQMKTIDISMRNIKDMQSSSREITMNIILGIVSVISAFQLFFVGTKMPFLSEYWKIESGTIGALLITIVAGVSIFVVLVFLTSAIKSIFQRRH